MTRTGSTDRPTVLVTGGTGTLGRLVVERLRAAGRPVRVLARHLPDDDAAPGQQGSRPAGVEYVAGDLANGEGVAAALAGVGVVVHCAGSATGDDAKTRTLVDAAVDAGVEHLVHISVVGVDRIPVQSRIDRAQFGYFEAKRLSEDIVTSSGLPWTILRATQFHDFVVDLTDQLGKMPVVPVFAGVSFQPVDARDVADRLTELALGEPQGLVDELGGPATYPMTELVRGYLHATGRHRIVLPMHNPGKAAAAYRAGANLTPAHATGTRTWEDFLAERSSERAAA
ncbi:SDR family oxidoreductase [Luteimicrobium sp. NPDC057192]|uniref:SDR family oxidoreductase n=1 Tax=Luteimicrobium sp. NPDC057192 TaxID=3346042 RepID=UPI0036320BD7